MAEDAARHELRVESLLNAPRTSVWRCWTDPRLLEQWFHPEGWTTEVQALELRPGGATRIVMGGPNGEVSEGAGVVLEVQPERRFAFTNAYMPGWVPAEPPTDTPFRTMVIELSDDGSGTRYVVRALHWSAEAKERHDAMGFRKGWKETAKRLELLARSISR